MNSEVEQRASKPVHHIDPGFINRRKCVSAFGLSLTAAYEANKHVGDDHMSELMNDHLLIYLALQECGKLDIPTLGEALSNPKEHQLVCSRENILGCGPSVWDEVRASNKVGIPFESEYSVKIEYHTEHIHATTQKVNLEQGAVMCVIGEIARVSSDEIVISPIIMGPPTFDHPANKGLPYDYSFAGNSHFQIYPGDIDEFSKVNDVVDSTSQEWSDFMKNTPEKEIKEAFCKLLSDLSEKDWGGEQYDHFTSNVSLAGKQCSAAFIFKGPSAWAEMKPKHLGKNADQIYRLQQSGADILILQHCHHIGEAVRETLAAFAVRPGNPRHYCFIDGKDTYNLLKAYDLLPE